MGHTMDERCAYELGTKSEGFWRCPNHGVVTVDYGIQSIPPFRLCAEHRNEA